MPTGNGTGRRAGDDAGPRGRAARRWIMRRFWIAPLGIIASLIAAAVIINQLRSAIDVFQLADPTGAFGRYFYLGGLAANLAVILVAVCVLLPRSQPDLRLGFAVVAFAPSLLQAIAMLPCFLSARPGALCGVGFIFVSYVSIPIVILAAIGFVATSGSRSVKTA